MAFGDGCCGCFSFFSRRHRSANVSTEVVALYSSAAAISHLPTKIPQAREQRKVIYLVRHAEALHNVEEKRAQEAVRNFGGTEAEAEAARKRVLTNPDFHDASLSRGGHEQARLACDDFHSLLRRTHYPMPELVFVSPLERALQTASLLFPHLPQHAVEFLREKRTGEPCDERKHASEIAVSFPSVDFADIEMRDEVSVDGYQFRPELREGNQQVAARAAPLLQFLRMQESKAMAVVTHKGILRELSKGPWANILDLDGGKLSTTFGNAEVRVCEVIWDRSGMPRIKARSLKDATSRPIHHVVTLTPGVAHPEPSPASATPKGESPMAEVMHYIHMKLSCDELGHGAPGSTPPLGDGLAAAVGTSEGDAAAAWDAMQARLGGPPTLALLFCTDGTDGPSVAAALRPKAGAAVVLGGSSSRGVLTRRGLSRVGVVGFRGLAMKYGLGSAEGASGSGARKAAAAAAKQAAAGHYPDLLLVVTAPGSEEEVLEGIRSVCGPVPVFGSSSSDGSVVDGGPTGRWWQLRGDLLAWEVSADSVVIAALWLYRDSSVAFLLSHLYGPEKGKSRVTKASGRLLAEIEHRPAAEVLNEVSCGAIHHRLSGGSVLQEMARFPLALEHRGHLRLVQAKAVLEHGQVECFGPVVVGTVRFLHSKASDVTGAATALARRAAAKATFEIRVALLAISAMTTAALEDSQLQELADAIGEALPEFFCYFTFGEQGIVNDAAQHGNLMINMAIFG